MHFILVPTTYDLSLIAHHVQKVGEPLVLECTLTAVRGITSRVDFVWSSDGVKLQENNKFGKDFTMLSLDIYSDTYTISPLSISDDNSTYHCEVIISIDPPLKDVANVTLDVTGIELLLYVAVTISKLYCSSYSYSQYNTIWSYTRSYGR